MNSDYFRMYLVYILVPFQYSMTSKPPGICLTYADIVKQSASCQQDSHIVVSQNSYQNRLKLVPKLSKKKCDHEDCAEIYNCRVNGHYKINGGCATALIKIEKDKIKILLGLERHGERQGQYNLCSGKMDRKDNKCCIKTSSRELYEEFRISFSVDDYIQKSKKIMMGGTPVFMIDCTHEPVDVEQINYELKQAFLKQAEPHLTEIVRVKWHDISHAANGRLTVLANNFIKKFKKTTLVD